MVQLFKSHNFNQPQVDFDWNIVNLEILSNAPWWYGIKSKVINGKYQKL